MDYPKDLPYQQAALVRQLLTERANAAAIGLTGRVDAVDKQLRDLGIDPATAELRRSTPPRDRRIPTAPTTAAPSETPPPAGSRRQRRRPRG